MSSKKRMLRLQTNAIRARIGDDLKTSRTRIRVDLKAVEEELRDIVQGCIDGGLEEEAQDQILSYLFTEEQRVRIFKLMLKITLRQEWMSHHQSADQKMETTKRPKNYFRKSKNGI